MLLGRSERVTLSYLGHSILWELISFTLVHARCSCQKPLTQASTEHVVSGKARRHSAL